MSVACCRLALVSAVALLALGLPTIVGWANGPAEAPAAAGAEHGAAEVGELIVQLGADSFAAREQAARRLAEIGVGARAPLTAALDDPDAEVRERARRILDYVLERDFQLRLRAFSADTDGSRGHALPGWDRYRQVIGDGTVARQLFVDMQRTESLLLEAAATAPESAGKLLDARLQALRADSFIEDALLDQPRSAGQAAALLFVGGAVDVPLTEASCDYIATFVRQPSFRQQASSPSRFQAPLRKLLGRWVGRYFGPGQSINQTNLFLAIEYDLSEGLALAAAMTADPALDAHLRPYAMLAVARFGGDDEIELLAPLLEDATPLQQIEDRQSEVRDVALAALVYLTDQPPGDYGLELERDELLSYDPLRFGYSDPNRRDQALARWREWAAANLPPAAAE